MNPSEMRSLIPALGLPECWYPALPDKAVPPRGPRGLKILGEEIAFFRSKGGDVVAVSDVCPHRGGSMQRGDCHYAGTLACPYHGWVFDERGECVAVLSEGPDSRIPGKVRIRTFPTQTHKGVVFVWMGRDAPAPIRQDVPPEFFEDEDTLVFTAIRSWPINWRVALENALDSHVMYVHRNSLLQLLEPILQFGALGYRPRQVGDRALLGYLAQSPRPTRDYYPGVDGYWPKSQWRRLWLWAFRWRQQQRAARAPFHQDQEWGMYTVVDGRRVRRLTVAPLVVDRFDGCGRASLARRWCGPSSTAVARPRRLRRAAISIEDGVVLSGPPKIRRGATAGRARGSVCARCCG